MWGGNVFPSPPPPPAALCTTPVHGPTRYPSAACPCHTRVCRDACSCSRRVFLHTLAHCVSVSYVCWGACSRTRRVSLRTLVHLSTHAISIRRVIVSHACREACSVHTACFAALHVSRPLRAGSWSPHWWWRRLLVGVDPRGWWVPSSTPMSYGRATGDCPGNLQPPTQGDPALPSQLNET